MASHGPHRDHPRFPGEKMAHKGQVKGRPAGKLRSRDHARAGNASPGSRSEGQSSPLLSKES